MTELGAFRYRRSPDRTFADWTLPRSANDPAVIAWRVSEGDWIVDDEISDAYCSLGPLTETELEKALAFARAMGWLPPDAHWEIRDVPD